MDIDTGGARPPHEPAATRRALQTSGVVALVATLAYLAWRVTATVEWSAWWVSVPLLVLEVHAALSLALFVFSTWHVDAVAPPPPATGAPGRVALLIPTYNEPIEVLLPTIAAAVALEPAHDTWVLDDGGRREVAQLAAELGANYLARETHEHAKAGNVNHALGVIDAEFVAIVDADHVALPGFLTNTLGYFADERLALVQTPQDFYNVDSFEHEERRGWFSRRGDRQRFNEQALFYRVIQAGKNRWGGAFWCGTGAVVRTAALREVGGVATETVTEDIHTTIRFHRAGWRSVYHNEVLARGLAAADADQFAAQRLRWGTGAMQVLRSRDNPLWCRGLTVPQRISYAATLLGWFEAWRSLGYLLVPPVVLATGVVPIRAHGATFALAFGATFVLQRLALQRLGRGFAPPVLSTIFELVRMTPNLAATLTLVVPGARAFRVTPKGRMGDERTRGHEPQLLDAVLVASLGAALWFAATIGGLTPLHYGVRWAAYGSAFWLVVNAALIAAAVARIRDDRFATERRASVRFDLACDALVDGAAAETIDVSLTGAKLRGDVLPAVGAAVRVALVIGGERVELDAVVRSRRDDRAGVEFAPGQSRVRAQLAVALFHEGIAPRLVGEAVDAGDQPVPANWVLAIAEV